jgi:hypothetical protein
MMATSVADRDVVEEGMDTRLAAGGIAGFPAGATIAQCTIPRKSGGRVPLDKVNPMKRRLPACPAGSLAAKTL